MHTQIRSKGRVKITTLCAGLFFLFSSALWSQTKTLVEITNTNQKGKLPKIGIAGIAIESSTFSLPSPMRRHSMLRLAMLYFHIIRFCLPIRY